MRRPSILIIDDEVEICLNLKDVLGFEGYDADYAITAKETFQKIEQKVYDLLLVDIKLEGRISGIDIIKSFRDKRERPKIIVISAIPLDGLEPSFQLGGITTLIDGYLDKPTCSDPEKFMAVVRRALGQHSWGGVKDAE